LSKPKSLSFFPKKTFAEAAYAHTQSVYDESIAQPPPSGKNPDTSTLELDKITDELFARSAQQRKSIYGDGDHRIDIYTAEQRRLTANAAGDPSPLEATFIEQAKAVGFLLHESLLRELPNGNYYTIPEIYGSTNGLCENELFWKEPCLTPGGIGTAFLVGPQKAFTANHCVPENIDPDSLRLVFGYALFSATIPPTISFRKEDVYKIEVVERNVNQDWVVLKLDHANPAPALKLGSGKPAKKAIVYALGYPSGLPLKISPGGKVETDLKDYKFLASVDAFGGNSGSPVLNAATHEVEGILVSGNDDFRVIPSGQCSRSVIINQAHAGETVCTISALPKP
jgi:hypothetical protein